MRPTTRSRKRLGRSCTSASPPGSRERGGDLVELDEVVGYHLEQAYRYRVELGPADEAARGLSERAAERLAAAGDEGGGARATCGRRPASSTRAVALYPADDARRLALLPPLGRALHEAGQWDRVERRVLAEAVRARERRQATAGWPPTAQSR